MVEWTDNSIIKLISLYETKPYLYNVRDKDYHNRIKKKLAADFIAKELGITGQRTVEYVRLFTIAGLADGMM